MSLAASAQQVVYVAAPPPMVDGPRFRGGVGLEGGAFIIPKAFTFGGIGIQGETGVQINNQWGVYAMPRLDIVFGHGGGAAVGAGAAFDFTFPDFPLTLGAGPEVGALIAGGGSSNGSSSTGGIAAAAYYGGMLRVMFHPVISRLGIRRKALTLGVDLHMLAGAYGGDTVTVSGTGSSASVSAGTSIGVSPMFYIGYTAF